MYAYTALKMSRPTALYRSPALYRWPKKAPHASSQKMAKTDLMRLSEYCEITYNTWAAM
jgi:hypothetical protein